VSSVLPVPLCVSALRQWYRVCQRQLVAGNGLMHSPELVIPGWPPRVKAGGQQPEFDRPGDAGPGSGREPSNAFPGTGHSPSSTVLPTPGFEPPD
jgi:hypothetical protein